MIIIIIKDHNRKSLPWARPFRVPQEEEIHGKKSSRCTRELMRQDGTSRRSKSLVRLCVVEDEQRVSSEVSRKVVVAER